MLECVILHDKEREREKRWQLNRKNRVKSETTNNLSSIRVVGTVYLYETANIQHPAFTNSIDIFSANRCTFWKQSVCRKLTFYCLHAHKLIWRYECPINCILSYRRKRERKVDTFVRIVPNPKRKQFIIIRSCSQHDVFCMRHPTSSIHKMHRQL